MKSTSFPRFAEDDEHLLFEEKMWARMQKDRRKRTKHADLFKLEGDDSLDALTHNGRMLGVRHEVEYSAESEADEDLDAEAVHTLHFGGHHPPAKARQLSHRF